MPSPDTVEDVLLFHIYCTNYAELICKMQNPNLFSKQGKKTLFVQQIAHYCKDLSSAVQQNYTDNPFGFQSAAEFSAGSV